MLLPFRRLFYSISINFLVPLTKYLTWFVLFILIFSCCFTHYPSIAIEDNGWKKNPILDIGAILKKLYKDKSLPTERSNPLPICNLFTYIHTHNN